MRIIRQSSYAAVPWKNGGGITHEAIRVPPDGDAFRWRVSLARIDSSGPFSDFAGYRRSMVLLKGAGVVLRFTSPADAAGSAGPRLRELRQIGDMAEFDGSVATHCDLLHGPCMDLNLMVSKNLPDVRARVQPLVEPRSEILRPGVCLLIFAIDAAIEVRCADHACVLERWDLALLSAGEHPSAHIAPSRSRRPNAGTTAFLAEIPSE